MQAFFDFRLFYNQSIHPELLHLETRRKKLLQLLGFSLVLLAGTLLLSFYLRTFVVTLALTIPVGLWISYILFRIQVFYQEFKPRVVGLLLDFIDNDINFGTFSYNPKGSISKERFLGSKIFTVADEYKGEDLLSGQVRETPFELCELRVQEFSEVRSRYEPVFNGIFLIGNFRRPDMHGGILVMPDSLKQYNVRSEKAFHLMGGRRVQKSLLPEFEATFDTFATPDARVKDVLSPEMQRIMLQFRLQFQQRNRKKELFLSIINDHIYLALTQDKNLLEPSILHSNAGFEQIREFYEDISLLLAIVKDVDVMN